MAGEQRGVEPARHEHRLGQEAEVDCPLEEEDAPEVEGPDEVLQGEAEEEGCGQHQLHPRTYRQLQHRTQPTLGGKLELKFLENISESSPVLRCSREEQRGRREGCSS